jgi:hypothetical protein
MIYLYIKTHNVTGLKYFGKTTNADYEAYKGSGTRWQNHIKKHGYDVTTELYRAFEDDDKEACLEAALAFSIENNIVESDNWANLKLETLDGGWDHINSLPPEERHNLCCSWNYTKSAEELAVISAKKARHKEDNFWWGKERSGELNPMFGKTHTDETKEKISKANKGKIRTPEQCKQISDRLTGTKRTFSEEHKKNIKLAAQNIQPVKCPHCEVVGSPSIMKRWHFDKCKHLDLNLTIP